MFKDIIYQIYSDIEIRIYELADKKILIFIIAAWLFNLQDKLIFKWLRLQCWLFGCEERGGYGGFNLPCDAYCFYCNRCGATYSNYEGNTNYHLLKGIFKRKYNA